MAKLYTMDDILAGCEKLRLTRVEGNIVFPSNPDKRVIPNREVPTEGLDLMCYVGEAGMIYAREIGIEQPMEGPMLDLGVEFMTLPNQGLAECFIRFHNLKRVREVIELFKQIGQAPPHFLMCYPEGGGDMVPFRAVDKAEYQNYRYELDGFTDHPEVFDAKAP
ncbi:MAG: hypothetical protein KKC75_06280 [Nanoarchaeota archaeon]|nr:hypothetical protein [Nanoarchaeota archaeon]MBU1004259.1 hypothetical protein [Nanoarchaeota archaeon]MBU1946136.1 hypothetical protein [Nanoarchaeota archaeon]